MLYGGEADFICLLTSGQVLNGPRVILHCEKAESLRPLWHLKLQLSCAGVREIKDGAAHRIVAIIASCVVVREDEWGDEEGMCTSGSASAAVSVSLGARVGFVGASHACMSSSHMCMFGALPISDSHRMPPPMPGIGSTCEQK